MTQLPEWIRSVQELVVEHQKRLQRHDEEMLEVRREAEQVRQMWIRIAKKNGWDDSLETASFQ